jgi:hypothetical protein
MRWVEDNDDPLEWSDTYMRSPILRRGWWAWALLAAAALGVLYAVAA